METDKFKVAIISLEDGERKFYEDMLSEYSRLGLEGFSTIQQFRNMCKDNQYSGIIVDNRTLIRSTMEDREFFSLLCEGFPVMRISRNPDNINISCLIEGKQLVDLKGKQLLDHFIRSDCTKISPHQVRINSRKQIFFNIMADFPEPNQSIKTNLWDISEGGCFVLATNGKNEMGDDIILTIQDFKDQTPIKGTVKWRKQWGTDISKLPGYGVSFIDITENQVQEIRSLPRLSYQG